MRGLTHFEIRACALALLAYGLFVPLAAVVLPRAEPAPTAVEEVAPAPRQPALVPPVVTDVVDAAPLSRTVALTFDDGPDPQWTPQVLDVLARHGAVATFCLLGDNAERHPELVTSIVGAGMRLCDHSRTHAIDPAAPADGLARTRLVELSGADVAWFRAPRGEWTDPLQAAAGAEGMRPLGWSVDSRDWTRPGIEAIVTQVQRQIHPGAVVLMHDGGGRRDQTVEALDRLLGWLTARCYTTGFPDGP
jgi:peptidoglycan/xylan/chitin deacetylase (PgdA/CDA1 family)